MAINKVIMTGRLTADPELKKTPTGISVCKFTIAQNKAKDGPPEFFDCVAWRLTAEFITRNFHKGDGIDFVGHLKCNAYEKNGVKRRDTEIVCDEVEFPLSRANRGTALPSYGSINEAYEELSSDDELPFN